MVGMTTYGQYIPWAAMAVLFGLLMFYLARRKALSMGGRRPN
jgi:hypothetical protein